MDVVAEPAYTRLQVDERRRQLIDAGSRAFGEHAYEDLSMREIAETAGVSKALLYHYFPSKIDLFKAAVDEKAQEIRRRSSLPARARRSSSSPPASTVTSPGCRPTRVSGRG